MSIYIIQKEPYYHKGKLNANPLETQRKNNEIQ